MKGSRCPLVSEHPWYTPGGNRKTVERKPRIAGVEGISGIKRLLVRLLMPTGRRVAIKGYYRHGLRLGFGDIEANKIGLIRWFSG